MWQGTLESRNGQPKSVPGFGDRLTQTTMPCKAIWPALLSSQAGIQDDMCYPHGKPSIFTCFTGQNLPARPWSWILIHMSQQQGQNVHKAEEIW